MRFKLNFELVDGSYDSVIVEAETIEEIREKAYAERDKRNSIYEWSEEI